VHNCKGRSINVRGLSGDAALVDRQNAGATAAAASATGRPPSVTAQGRRRPASPAVSIDSLISTAGDSEEGDRPLSTASMLLAMN